MSWSTLTSTLTRYIKPNILSSSLSPSLLPSIYIRSFGHGTDKYSANGAYKYKRNYHVKDPSKLKNSVKRAKKERRLMVKNKNEKINKEIQKKFTKQERIREKLGIVSSKDIGEQTKLDTNAYRFGISENIVNRLEAPIAQMLNFVNASNKEIVQQRNRQWVAKYGADEDDFGNTAVQIAILSERIKNLSLHMITHTKDLNTRRGLEAMHSRRRKLMWYLRLRDYKLYAKLIEDIKIPDSMPPLQGYGFDITNYGINRH